MILRLNGADFSANNIGVITITNELTEETTKLLSNYTRELTESQKFAVQNFIKGLKAKNIWGVISNLYLPILCGSEEELFYNIKTNTLDAVASNEYYDITDKGVASLNVTDTAKISKIPVNASQQNLHLAVYNTEEYPELTANEILYGNGSNTQLIQLLYSISNHIEVKTDGNVTLSLSNLEQSTAKKLRGISQSTIGNMDISSLQYDSNPIATDNTYSNFPLGVLGLASLAGRASAVHYGLFSVGSSLTVEQATYYSMLCDEFFANFVD